MAWRPSKGARGSAVGDLHTEVRNDSREPSLKVSRLWRRAARGRSGVIAVAASPVAATGYRTAAVSRMKDGRYNAEARSTVEVVEPGTTSVALCGTAPSVSTSTRGSQRGAGPPQLNRPSAWIASGAESDRHAGHGSKEACYRDRDTRCVHEIDGSDPFDVPSAGTTPAGVVQGPAGVAALGALGHRTLSAGDP